MKHHISILVGLAVLLVGGSTLAKDKLPAGGGEKSLYERLGGAYNIAMVVDAFIEKLLINDVLNANPAIDEARRRVPKEGLKFHVTSLVCQATGGPCQYTGRAMKEAHKHLNITEKEWEVMAADFVAILNQFKVPHAEQQELLTIVGTTKADIVMPAAQAER